MRKSATKFAVFHVVHIVIFTLIYYYLMMDMKTHFVITNSQIPSSIYENKLFNSLFYACAIESTNGLVDVLPSSVLSRTITNIQYITTIFVSLGSFIYIMN